MSQFNSSAYTMYPQTAARVRQTPMPMSGPSDDSRPYNPGANINAEKSAGTALNEYQVAAGNDLYNGLTPQQRSTFTPVNAPSYPQTAPNDGAFHNTDNTEGITKQAFKDQFGDALKAGRGDEFAARFGPQAKGGGPIGPTPTGEAQGGELAFSPPITPQSRFDSLNQNYRTATAAREAMVPLPKYQANQAYQDALRNPPEAPAVTAARIRGQYGLQNTQLQNQGKLAVAGTAKPVGTLDPSVVNRNNATAEAAKAKIDALKQAGFDKASNEDRQLLFKTWNAEHTTASQEHMAYQMRKATALATGKTFTEDEPTEKALPFEEWLKAKNAPAPSSTRPLPGIDVTNGNRPQPSPSSSGGPTNPAGVAAPAPTGAPAGPKSVTVNGVAFSDNGDGTITHPNGTIYIVQNGRIVGKK